MEAKLYLNIRKNTELFCFLKIRTNLKQGVRSLILIPKFLRDLAKGIKHYFFLESFFFLNL